MTDVVVTTSVTAETDVASVQTTNDEISELFQIISYDNKLVAIYSTQKGNLKPDETNCGLSFSIR